MPIEEYLKDELATPQDTKSHVESMGRLSTIPWTSGRAKKWPDDARADWICGSIFPGELPCYNPRTAKFENFTDVLWRTAIIASLAMSGERIRRSFCPGHTRGRVCGRT
jgi:hypothetical protein